MNQVDRSSELAAGIDASTNYDGICYALNGLRDFSIQVVFSDPSLEGTLLLEASNDPTCETDPDNAVWIPVADSSQAVSAGTPHMWNVYDANYKYVRFTWTASAGTGTLTAWLEIKFLEG